MNSEMESTAMREAISPAAWPPMPSAAGNARGGLGQVVRGFAVRCIVLSGHVEIFVGGAKVAVAKGLHALRQINFRHLREIYGVGGAAGGRGDLGVVLLPARRVGQHVH